MQDPTNVSIPPDPPASPDDLPLLDPAELRATQTVRVDIGGGRAVIARKVDLTAMMFEGAIPLPLLSAVQNLTNGVDGLAAMPDSDRLSMMKMFQDHAVRVVIQPPLTATDDGDPHHLPVTFLHMPQLMAIWEATTAASVVTASAALRFRPTPSPIPAPVVHDGQDVRPPAEQLAAEPAPARSEPQQPGLEIQFA